MKRLQYQQKLSEIEKRQAELRARKQNLLNALVTTNDFRPISAEQKDGLNVNPLTLTNELSRLELFSQLYALKCLYFLGISNPPTDRAKLQEFRQGMRFLSDRISVTGLEGKT